MKITIFAAGSRGDIQPCIVLGKGLQQAGYQVLLAAPGDFAGFVQQFPALLPIARGCPEDHGQRYRSEIHGDKWSQSS